MLWGVPFIQLQQDVTLQQATHLISLVFIGWIIGTPLIGFIADYYLKRKIIMGSGILLVLILFLIIAYLPVTLNVIRCCLFLIGLFSSTQIITYLVARESNPNHSKGSAIGVTNCIVFTWTALLTPLLGVIIHHFSSQHPGSETLADYHHAMIVVPIYLCIAAISLFFCKETDGQKSQ